MFWCTITPTTIQALVFADRAPLLRGTPFSAAVLADGLGQGATLHTWPAYLCWSSVDNTGQPAVRRDIRTLPTPAGTVYAGLLFENGNNWGAYYAVPGFPWQADILPEDAPAHT